MKTKNLHISLMALAIVFLVVSCGKESMNSDLANRSQAGSSNGLKAGKALGTGVSASGQGTLNVAYLNGTQHFAFQAKKTAGGLVSGSFETHSPGQNLDVHGKVVCLMVSGNEATVSAQVTKINADNTWGVAVGSFISFKVKDNGEGAKAPADGFSDYFFTGISQFDCNSPLNLAYLDISGGNIQVKQ